MELKINIDESQFKEVLEQELKAFSKEELKNIIREGLIKCMSDVSIFKNLFVDESRNYLGEATYKANEVLKEAAKTINYSPLFEEFQNKIVEYIEKS